MDYLGRFISFLGVLALFVPSAALAQGTITGINVEPASVAACTLVKITVTGTGNCSSFSFDLGDGTTVAHFPGAFPFLFYHTYTKARTYSLTAQGQGTCSGKVTASLSVAGPTVTGIFPSNVATPQHDLILEGLHFGSLPGQVLLHLTNYNGQSLDLPLNVISQWMDTAVAVNIPFVPGLLKQQATLTLITQCGASTTWNIEFTPLNDIALILFDRITCSTSIGASVSDECQNWGGTRFPPECALALGGGIPTWGLMQNSTGYFGFHASGWGGGNSGHDEFWPSPPLKNGWVFDSLQNFGWYNLGGGSQESHDGLVNTSDPTTPRLDVNWHVDACGVVDYGGDIQIIGPADTPY